MKQIEIDKLMNEIDRKCKLPKHWDKFINKYYNSQNILIKDSKNKNIYCTKCNKYFVNKDIKVRDYTKCPICHTKLRTYGVNYYKKSFKQSVVLPQRMNKQVIIRIFELYSYFEENEKRMTRSCMEYARIIPGIGRFFRCNVDISIYGKYWVNHDYDVLRWYKHNSHKYFFYNPTYPYNKKKLVKGTIMEYAPIEEYAKKFPYRVSNFLEVLEYAAYPSFELLWHIKLYNLCINAKALNKSGSFQKRFGVPKNFLKIMQENDIWYKDLMILQIFQKADAELLRKYSEININHLRFLVKNNILDEVLSLKIWLDDDTIKLMKKISKFVPLKKLVKYPHLMKNLYIYYDYLQMSKELGLNYKSKNDLYPENLIARHDELQNKIKINEDMYTQIATYIRYLELSKYTYTDDRYIIFPANSVDSMIDEGKQQGNCVGNVYLKRYNNCETEIFFVRMLDNINKSFITVEFNNGKIVQKELPHHNRDFTEEQNDFLSKWKEYRKFVDMKEKYKSKQKQKLGKIAIEKLIA